MEDLGFFGTSHHARRALDLCEEYACRAVLVVNVASKCGLTPQYAALGDVRWNFEKWLVSPEGDVVARFSPQTVPDDPSVVAAIEAALPAEGWLTRLLSQPPRRQDLTAAPNLEV